ncbi:MAG: hypothetical protein KGS61_10590 [Verrucomicrobia bacterium]|nr:hypothetical protein [Verrucomicrobiota bacterium]
MIEHQIDLEAYCVIQPYAEAWRPPYDGKFHKVGPGRLRKRYPLSKKDRRIYMGAVLEPKDKLRPVEEIRRLVDTHPLGDVRRQADDALKQLLYRAHCGDAQALAQYVRITHAAVQSLETLATHHPDSVRAEAETFPDWPLNLSQHETAWVKQELKRLGVGAKFPLSTRSSLRARRRYRLTRLAWDALLACVENKPVVPALKALAAGARSERKAIPYSRQTKAWATFYYLNNGDVVIVTDWQARCAKLSGPITKTNINAWWDALKECVLQHWHNPEGNYEAVLALIPDAQPKGNPPEQPRSDEYYKQNKEYRKRNFALARVKQAFETLVGVRCST